MTKNTVRKAISIIVVAILLIAIAAQALYPIQVAASPSPGNILLYDAFDGYTLGEIKGSVSFAPSGDNTQGFDMEGCVCFDGDGEGTWGGYILYGVEGQQSPFVKNPGTLELWVKKGDWTLADGRREDILRTSTNNTEGIQLLLYGAELWFYAQSSVPAVVYPTSGLDTGWHHFAIAWDNTGTILYIDGENKGSGVGITSIHNTLGLSAGEELDGCIDELASYDYKKTLSEILEDFEAKSSPHKILEPPIADANGPYSGYEGSPITFNGTSSSDPDGIVAYDWDLDDDGQFDDAKGATTSYIWGDNYTGNIGLKVTYSDERSDTDTTTVTVYNVDPTVEAGADQEVNQDDIVSFSGNFTDPGWLDTHTIHWNFGDNVTADGSLQVDHSYAEPDTYTVTLTVTDDDGGAGSDTLQVTVIDMPYGARAMLEFQIEKAKIEVSKGKVSVKGTLELDPSGDGVDISEEVVVIMGPLSETIPGGTMVVDKKGKWEYKQPTGVEGIIKKMKIDWKKGKFEFSMDKAYLSELTDPDNVTISIQIGDDFGQKTITMVITYEYSMPS